MPVSWVDLPPAPQENSSNQSKSRNVLARVTKCFLPFLKELEGTARDTASIVSNRTGSALDVKEKSPTAAAKARSKASSLKAPKKQWKPVLTINPEAFDEKMARALAAGRERMFWVCDFDRTVTHCFLEDGSKSLDCHDILASIPKITPECKAKMEEMMDYYYPIEIHPTMTKEEKIPHMVEWYTKVNLLLGAQNLTRDDVVAAVAGCANFRIRAGVEEAFGLAYKKNIPLIIVSAGLGNVIEEIVRQHICMPTGADVEQHNSVKRNEWPNVRVLSNTIQWDADGNQSGWSEPLLHMYNKSLQDAPAEIKAMLKGRDVGILSGDGTGDLTMAHGVETTDVLKFGFLNEKVGARMGKYIGCEGYDRVVLDDADFSMMLEVLRRI